MNRKPGAVSVKEVLMNGDQGATKSAAKLRLEVSESYLAMTWKVSPGGESTVQER